MIIFFKCVAISDSDGEVNGLAEAIDELQLAAKHRSVAGVLVSHPDSRDVHIDQMTIRFHGAELLVDSKLELNCGRRYGLIGLNGCGRFIIDWFINSNFVANLYFLSKK